MIIQFPNIPLAVWIVGLLLVKVLPSGGFSEFCRHISTLGLVVWGIIEILYGVNYFRRLLGAAIIISTVYGLTR
ncbi:MAG: hypothetical protein WCJ86_00635 [Candidatus Saccharibacteria bacterium]